MVVFEYRVVPAPTRGLKARGVKGTPARFANALETLMNEMGAEGWEYQRTDTLPVEERQGLTGKTTAFQNMLVFRRLVEAPAADEAEPITALIEDQSKPAPEPVIVSEEQPEEAPTDDIAANAKDDAEAAGLQEDLAKDDARADERVNETLKAPFEFPWSNRRTRTPGAANDDIARVTD